MDTSRGPPPLDLVKPILRVCQIGRVPLLDEFAQGVFPSRDGIGHVVNLGGGQWGGVGLGFIEAIVIPVEFLFETIDLLA